MKKVKIIISTFYLTIFNILLSSVIVLNTTSIYNLAINLFNIDILTKVSKTNLYNDYCRIIKFINNKEVDDLHFKNFTLSSNGKYHFTEVKEIFTSIYYFLIISLIIFLFILMIRKIKKSTVNIKIFNYSLLVIIFLSAIIITSAFINFTYIFKYFHQIVFDNSYWIFDKVKDSIILALPENFFMLCVIIILFISILISLFEKILIKYIYNLK